MGFEVYVQCFGESVGSGISRAAVRRLFPVIEQESEPDYWRIHYDQTNSCTIAVTPIPSDKERLKSLFVERPCGDLRLWDALLSVLRMGRVVIFWPGSPPIVSDAVLASELPKDMTNALGRVRIVTSGEDFLSLLRET